MTTLRQAAEQALISLERADKISGHANNKATIATLRQSLEADTTPCVCCGDGNSRLSVTRICDTCGSEYAGQAEMDMAKRIEAEQQAEPVYWEHRVPVVGEFGQTVGYSKWKPGKGLSHWPHRALYEHPQPTAQWVGLTDEERQAVFESLPNALDGFLKLWGWLHFSKAVEAKLREKNSGAQARKPLTEMEIVELRQLTPGTLDVQFVKFARAIERAHGIGGEA